MRIMILTHVISSLGLDSRPMANNQHLALLRESVTEWNTWRTETPDVVPDLRGADLREADLREADLRQANLGEANLVRADLREANLYEADLHDANLAYADLTRALFIVADLTGARLSESNLEHADLSGARLGGADLSNAKMTDTMLSGADLSSANLRKAVLHSAQLQKAVLRDADLHRARLMGAHFGDADLEAADLTEASFKDTVLANVDLSRVSGLESCVHYGPSIIDHRTLLLSGSLPLGFLRGCGLPDRLIDYLPSLLESGPIQFYSCFISYSRADQDFANRLYADLQNNGVRCWFAPHDMLGGRRIHDQIDEAIRTYDRLLLILSKESMSSPWVSTEISQGPSKGNHCATQCPVSGCAGAVRKRSRMAAVRRRCR